MADDLYYGDAGLNRRLFLATAIVTAPVIFSTAAGTGGPLLWNSSSTVFGRLVAMSFAETTASAVAGAIGLTGGTGQTAAPGSTTAIDSVNCTNMAGVAPAIVPYRVGTVSSAGSWFYPLGQVGTGAVTVQTAGLNFVPLQRVFVIPPNGGWLSVAASATLTSGVFQIGLIWEEIPLVTK